MTNIGDESGAGSAKPRVGNLQQSSSEEHELEAARDLQLCEERLRLLLTVVRHELASHDRYDACSVKVQEEASAVLLCVGDEILVVSNAPSKDSGMVGRLKFWTLRETGETHEVVVPSQPLTPNGEPLESALDAAVEQFVAGLIGGSEEAAKETSDVELSAGLRFFIYIVIGIVAMAVGGLLGLLFGRGDGFVIFGLVTLCLGAGRFYWDRRRERGKTSSEILSPVKEDKD